MRDMQEKAEQPERGLPSWWKRGTYLHERAVGVTPAQAPATAEHSVYAQKRLERWRTGMGDDTQVFEQRLALDGFAKTTLLALLADVEVHLVGTGQTPAWVEQLADILSDRYAAEIVSGQPGQQSSPTTETAATTTKMLAPAETSTANDTDTDAPPLELTPFRAFLLPFLQYATARLHSVVAELARQSAVPASFLSPAAEVDLLREIAQLLATQTTRTLVLELNIARLQDQLAGDTPEERFHSYITEMLPNRDYQQSVLERYPLLARLLTSTIDRWLVRYHEFLQRFLSDRQRIAEHMLDGQQPEGIVRLRSGLSDPHKGGRHVLAVTLTSGAQLIYKPKSLAVDQQFQTLLHWLNEHGLRHPLRALRILDQRQYGWVEWVETLPCSTLEEVQRFYWRQGSYLAILYLLCAVDFHFENLIASGEQPVLVDVEALFHQHIATPEEQQDVAFVRALQHLDQSVLRTGLLPMRLPAKDGRVGVDISGLGAKEGQVYQNPTPVIEEVQTDTMHFALKHLTMQGGHNRPSLDGQPQDAAAFVEDIIAGFRETYQLLQQQREALTEQLNAFAEVEIRYIARPTYRYALFIQEGHHPDYLRDGLDKDMLLDKLWAETAVWPKLKQLLPAELADLRAEDIPFFTTHPGERHLWDSQGQRLDDYFDSDSLSEVQQRLTALDASDCDAQTALLRGTMMTLVQQHSPTGRATTLPEQQPADTQELPEPAAADYLQAAVTIGEYLQRQAILGAKDASWIGVSLVGNSLRDWMTAPVGVNLYDGVAGIALFLAYLGRASGREDFTTLARAASEPLKYPKEPLSTEQAKSIGIGAFAGIAANIYVLQHLAALWDEPALLDEAGKWLNDLEAIISQDERLDIISGAAGCVLVLLNLYQQTDNQQALRCAKLCGNRLLATAEPIGDGLGWRVFDDSEPLAGLSHGATGFTWALGMLAAATGDDRYAEAARKSMVYERTLYVPEQRNWQDKRNLPEEIVKQKHREADQIPVQWCHGAPGVALGRFELLTHAPQFAADSTMHEEILIGLQTTIAAGRIGNHSLCHGDLGICDILLLAAEELQDPHWQATVPAIGAEVVRSVQQRQWICGLPLDIETSGLMVGVAGKGYGLLRLWNPQQVPSVLRLAAPILSTSATESSISQA